MNESGLGSFYAYRNTFNEDNVWVDVPKNGENLSLPASWTLAKRLFAVTFLNITDPYNIEPTPEPEFQPTSSDSTIAQGLEDRPTENYFHMPYDDASGLEALSAAATSKFEYVRPLSAAVQSPSEGSVTHHSSNNLDFILNPVGPEGNMSRCSGNALPAYADIEEIQQHCSKLILP